MIRKITYFILFCLMFPIMALPTFAQSKSELEIKISQLEKDIKTAEKLLKQTAKNKEGTLHEVNLMQVQISQREALINGYKKQMSLLNKEISRNKQDINNLQKRLEEYRQEYSDLLVISYKNRNKLNNLLFIFSSEDFNQVIRRMRYINEFHDLLKQKMEEIENAKAQIKNKLTQNESNKRENQKLIDAQNKEKAALLADKKKLENKLTELKKKEKLILKEIEEKNREAEELQKRIVNVIEVETKKVHEREGVAKTNRKTSVDSQLSSGFENNKGKLPWPCEGIITGRYGKSQHPTQEKVTINNHGIDITTTEGSAAYCVFNGVVSTVFNTGKTNVVMVRHGLYFTLYANLEKVFVKSGQNLKTGDKIGIIHTKSNDKTTVLHFEVWNEKDHTNPNNWLKK